MCTTRLAIARCSGNAVLYTWRVVDAPGGRQHSVRSGGDLPQQSLDRGRVRRGTPSVGNVTGRGLQLQYDAENRLVWSALTNASTVNADSEP